MPLLSDVGAYLISQTTLSLNYGASTGNLFLGALLEQSPDAAVALIEYPGMAPTRAHSSSLGAPVAEHPRFQVVVRDVLNNYATARAKAESIYQSLDHLGQQTLGSTRYLNIVAIQPPFYLEEDGNGRHKFAFNCEATKERG